jgi:5-methylcytosine-specific restriction endonuclease McrA
VPEQDILAPAMDQAISLPIADLKRTIRHELRSAQAVAALVVLANRAQSEQTVITYRDYLQSDTWKDKRRAKLEQKGRSCERCSSTTKIQVHHKTYDRIGHERLSDLEILCDACHKAHHDATK